LQAAVDAGVPVCLMHMQGQPRSMQQAPQYTDVVAEVSEFLQQRVECCLAAGIKQQQIIVDPGFGFGKSLTHNYRLLNNLQQLQQLNLPVLVGLSRKSMFGALLNRDVDDRLAASLAGAVIALQKGAHIIRVHDVKETKDAMKVVSMLNA
jgi:dihydropteroate synthase